MVVSPGAAGAAGGALLLAQPGNAEEAAQIGRQTGGRVGHFLHTTDFDGDLAHMRQQGVRFLETPRHEVYGSVVVFQDPWGNRWDLIQPSASAAA